MGPVAVGRGSVRAADPGAVLLEKTGTFILHMGCERSELRSVLVRVVRAEQQLAARHHDAHIRLRAASVAAVRYCQRFDHRRVHNSM